MPPRTGLWPPTKERAPKYLGLVLAVWTALYLTMRTTNTALDLRLEKRRGAALLDKLARIAHEYVETSKKQKKWKEKEAWHIDKVREQLKSSRVGAGGGGSAEDVAAWSDATVKRTNEYQALIRQTGFSLEASQEYVG